MVLRNVRTKKTQRRNGLPHTNKFVCIRPNDFMKQTIKKALKVLKFLFTKSFAAFEKDQEAEQEEE